MQQMFQKKNWFYAALMSAVVMAVLYGVPTILEWKMETWWGMLPTVLFGNLIGCGFIALFDWKRGVALYGTLNLCEWLLVYAAVIPARTAILFADLVPAAIIATFVLPVAGYALELMDGVEPRNTGKAWSWFARPN